MLWNKMKRKKIQYGTSSLSAGKKQKPNRKRIAPYQENNYQVAQPKGISGQPRLAIRTGKKICWSWYRWTYLWVEAETEEKQEVLSGQRVCADGLFQCISHRRTSQTLVHWQGSSGSRTPDQETKTEKIRRLSVSSLSHTVYQKPRTDSSVSRLYWQEIYYRKLWPRKHIFKQLLQPVQTVSNSTNLSRKSHLCYSAMERAVENISHTRRWASW